MSDITFRSQQAAEQSRQFSDQRRDNANQQMVGTLHQVGRDYVANRQQQVQMQMQQHQFQQQQDNMQRELSMQEADASMRLAIGQQEQAMNQQKLMMMQAMDQADMGRQAVLQQQMQTKRMELDLKMAEKQAESADEDKAETRFQNLLRSAGGMDELDRAGIFVDPVTRTSRRMTTDELTSRDDRRAAATQGASFNQERTVLSEMLRTLPSEPHMDDGEQAEQRKFLMGELAKRLPGVAEGMAEATKRASQQPQGGSQAGGATVEAAAEPRSATFNRTQARVETALLRIESARSIPRPLGQLQQSQSQRTEIAKKLTEYFERNRDTIIRDVRANPSAGRTVDKDDDRIIGDAIQVLGNKSDPKFAQWIKWLIREGTLTEQDAILLYQEQ